MNVRNWPKLLFSAALVLCASCSDDKTASVSPEQITLSTQEITLNSSGYGTLTVTVTPADAAVDAADFALVDASSGNPARFVTLQSDNAGKNGVFAMSVRDNGAGKKYAEVVKIACAKASLLSEELTVRSKPYTPVVRLTTTQPVTNKEDWIAGTIEIDGGNGFDDLAQMAVEVRGRGNSTWSWAKKPYALKLSSKKEVLGMKKHKRWCLIANYMDRTHLRNRVAYYIGQHSNLAYTVHSEYVELYLNGSYNGCYLLTEQIKVDDNRVAIKEMEPTDNEGEAVTGGYLLELDTYYDEEKKFRTTATNIPVNIKYPDPEDLSDAQFNYIRDYMNRADAAVAAVGRGDSSARPFDYIDQTSMVDFWIIYELMANHEILHPKSIYFHKDRGGKLVAGPIWDFDYQSLIADTQTRWIDFNNALTYNEFEWYDTNWWNQLLIHDAQFKAAVKARWTEWYPFLKTIPEFMEQERLSITTAVGRDNGRWPTIQGTGNVNGDETLSFASAVGRLKSVYTTRLAWLNNQISNW